MELLNVMSNQLLSQISSHRESSVVSENETGRHDNLLIGIFTTLEALACVNEDYCHILADKITLPLIRGKVASCKNCQLVNYNHDLFFEFGKINNLLFSVIFRNPINEIQAFCIALSLF